MVVWIISLPALVVLLCALALIDQVLLWLGKARVLPWRRRTGERRVSATGFEVLHAHLSAGKAQELKQRCTTPVLRDDEQAGGRPRSAVDLDAGTAVIRAAAQSPNSAAVSRPRTTPTLDG
jgi:hypothetical protein